MPEEVFIDSNGRLSSTSSASTKHKGDKSEVIDILRDMQAGHQQKKAKEEHWRDKEEVYREREEEHRSMEHLFEAWCKAQDEAWKEKEEAHKDREE